VFTANQACANQRDAKWRHQYAHSRPSRHVNFKPRNLSNDLSVIVPPQDISAALTIRDDPQIIRESLKPYRKSGYHIVTGTRDMYDKVSNI
jgi:hypothetical protein